jgi:hypothetical protein
MKPSNLDLSLLVAVYELARTGEPANVLNLAERLQQPAYVVLESALRLAMAGCLDASRLRLTFRGLALAEAQRRAKKGKSVTRKAVPRKSEIRASVQRVETPDPQTAGSDPSLCADHFNAQALKGSVQKFRNLSKNRG